VRLKIEISGIVQGVGFRPLIYRLATKQRLVGSVCNATNAVVIEAEGESTAIEAFLDELLAHPPKNARIDTIKKEPISPKIANTSLSSTPKTLQIQTILRQCC